MTTGTAAKLLVACRADQAKSFRNAIQAFSKLVRAQNKHAPTAYLLPNEPIGPLPLLSDAPLDWSRFSGDFLASRDRAITKAVRPGRTERRDRFDGHLRRNGFGDADSRKGRKRKAQNPEAIRKELLNTLSWLIRHAFPECEKAYALKRIEGLIEPLIVTRAVDVYIVRAPVSDTLIDPNDTASVSGHARAGADRPGTRLPDADHRSGHQPR